jgi:aspartate kinase
MMTNLTVVVSFDDDDLATPEGVTAAARALADEQDAGRRVVAVLPAMGDAGDWLRELAHAVSPEPDARELDMLVTTGARISCALCAMALIDRGRRAVSLTGSQAGIITDARHGDATVVDVRADRVREALDDGAIVLVAGSQGVSTEAEVTAVGRRTVDETAAALAGALGATLVSHLPADGGAVR